MLHEATEDRQAITAEVSHAVVRIMKRNLGRGPTRCRTELRPGYAIVFCGDTLTEVEKTLLGAGKRDQVKVARGVVAEAIRDELVESVEAITGRRVSAVASDVDATANLAIHVFVFEERPAPPGSDNGASAQVNGR